MTSPARDPIYNTKAELFALRARKGELQEQLAEIEPRIIHLRGMIEGYAIQVQTPAPE